MIDYALGYAKRGWPVFVLSATKSPVGNCPPCDPKKPEYVEHEMATCGHLTCHSFYAATTDPERIKEMIRLHPRGCLAIRTGAASGIAVVDVDFKDFDEDGVVSRQDQGFLTLTALDRQKLLPGTLTAITGSGGLHLLYAHPGGYVMSGANMVGAKVDSKADGGYIVAPPSIHYRTKTPYRWSGDGRYDYLLTPLHETLAARLRPAEPTTVRTSGPSPFARPGAARGRLAGLLRTVMESDGNRNDRLYWAAKKAAEMVASGEMTESVVVDALQQVGREIGLADNEIGHATKGTVGSGLRNGRRVAA